MQFTGEDKEPFTVDHETVVIPLDHLAEAIIVQRPLPEGIVLSGDTNAVRDGGQERKS
jgi:hypothetical protein